MTTTMACVNIGYWEAKVDRLAREKEISLAEIATAEQAYQETGDALTSDIIVALKIEIAAIEAEITAVRGLVCKLKERLSQ